MRISRTLRHIVAWLVTPYAASVLFATIVGGRDEDTARTLGCIMGILIIPLAAPFFVTALFLRLKNPIWYAVGGIGVAFSPFVFDLLGFHRLGFGNFEYLDRATALAQLTIGGLLGGALYFFVAEMRWGALLTSFEASPGGGPTQEAPGKGCGYFSFRRSGCLFSVIALLAILWMLL